jgi:hypothetical protein
MQTEMGNRVNEVASKTKEAYALGSRVLRLGIFIDLIIMLTACQWIDELEEDGVIQRASI